MNKRMISFLLVLILLLSACHANPSDFAAETHTSQTSAEAYSSRTSAETNMSQTSVVSEQGEILIQGLKESGLTVEKLIAAAPYIFEGVCLSKNSKGERGTELRVQIQKDYSGKIKESETVIVRTRNGSSVQRNSSYLFFTEANASIYEGIPLMYHAYAMANSKGEPLGEDYYGIASYSKTELEICIAKTLSDPGFLANWDVFGAYCTSENPKDIYEFSTHVLTGKVEAVDLNGVYDRTSYHVSVKENLKGHAPDEIVVVAFKDSLKIGESYLFLLTGYIDPESFTYTLAGVNAVFPPDYEIFKLKGISVMYPRYCLPVSLM